jgi:mannose-6-phosphate isomerase
MSDKSPGFAVGARARPTVGKIPIPRNSERSRRASAVKPAAGAYETRPWGSFEVLAEGTGYKVKRLVVEPGHRLSLQRHRFRAEHWVVVAGTPRVRIANRTLRLKARASVTVPKGAWHRIENPGTVPAVIVEVQHGAYLGEDDILRRADDYGRARASVISKAPTSP